MICGNKKSRFIEDQEAKMTNLLGKILFSPVALFELIQKKKSVL